MRRRLAGLSLLTGALLAAGAHAGMQDTLDALRMVRALRSLGKVASVRVSGEIRRTPLDAALESRLAKRVDLRLTLRTGRKARVALQIPLVPARWIREARPDVTALSLHVHLERDALLVGAILPGREGGAFS